MYYLVQACTVSTIDTFGSFQSHADKNLVVLLARSTVRLEGRKLAVEKLVSGKKLVFKVNDKADWTREVTTTTTV